MRKLLTSILSVTLLFILSCGNTKTAGATISKKAALEIGTKSAQKQFSVQELEKYEVSINLSHDKLMWVVMFELKPKYVPKPGDYFAILVDIKTGIARYMPGQ